VPSPRRQASTTSAPEASSAATSSRRSASSLAAVLAGSAARRGARAWPRLRHLGQQRGHARAAGGVVRARKGRACRVDAQRAQRQFRRRQLGHRRHRAERGRQAARIDQGQRGRGLFEPAEQQQPARRDEPRLQRVGMVRARLERGGGRGQHARRTAEVAHGQRDLGLGDHAAGARQFFVRAEAARGAPQQFARARVLAELRHRDAAQRQRGRVVAQGHALERAERIAGSQCACGSGNQRIHGIRRCSAAGGAPVQPCGACAARSAARAPRAAA
jgi:hypothetical protein